MAMDSKLLAAGMRHYRSGAFQEAHEIYRQHLAANPQDAMAFNLLGAVCIDLGQLSEASEYLAESLRLNPGLAAAHNNLGLLLMEQSEFIEAVSSFRRAVSLDPRSTPTQLNLANALLRSGQTAEAIEALRQAVQGAPDNVRAHAESARLLCQEGRHAEALPHLRNVTRLVPDDAGAHVELAKALAQTDQKSASIAAYQAAIQLKPDSPEACASLANLYSEQKLFDAAVLWSRRALELRPRFAEAYNTLGCALLGQEKCEEAIRALQTAVIVEPQLGQAYNNLGVAFAAIGKFGLAIEHYRHALSLRETDLETMCNLGNIHLKLGDLEAALAQYDRAIELRADYGHAHHNRAVAWLLQERFSEGFAEFEWRLRLQDYPPAPLPWKLWNGEPLAGRTIVMCIEGGLGDTLQFVRFAPQLKQQDARVVVLCDPVLIPILARTGDVDAWITSTREPFEADFCVPMMSLPHRLHTTLATIPAPIPYVFADPRLVEKWKSTLAQSEGFKVGIIWQGNRQMLWDRHRSIPLSHYAPLARVPGVQLVNLQKGAGIEQLREFAEAWGVIDFSQQIDKSAGAFMDTAAIMKNLDLVITSDTAAAHLAGALGARVWLAVHRVPDWRWMLEREDSPWYPTMRIFRQKQLGEWSEVFERIAGELQQLVAQGSAG